MPKQTKLVSLMCIDTHNKRGGKFRFFLIWNLYETFISVPNHWQLSVRAGGKGKAMGRTLQ